MNAFLMYPDRDFELSRKLPANEEALVQDLGLEVLFQAMAGGDKLIYDVARAAVLTGQDNDIGTVFYRQAILKDCLANPQAIRRLYGIAQETMENKRKNWWGVFKNSRPSLILSESVGMMEIFVDSLEKLGDLALMASGRFGSQGFIRFFKMLAEELDGGYLEGVRRHLGELKFPHGALLSVQLGEGNAGDRYCLCRPPMKKGGWLKEILARKRQSYTFALHPRDISGARFLSELKDRGLSSAAEALARAGDHVQHFMEMLLVETAFYVGCVNLYERLAGLGAPVCLPLPFPAHDRRHSFQGLYDPCLALTMKKRPVGIDAQADYKDLIVVTGANQGGKSTFLRSIGLAQLLMQAGMFAPAESFGANLCPGLFTHYKREEDPAMQRGRLDDELSRMSDMVDLLQRNSLVLFNESFAATNEREGSEIARQIVEALLASRVKVFFVTHLHDFASRLYAEKRGNVLFLRAERQAKGKRPFKIVAAEPLPTSYGQDLFNDVFGANPARYDSPAD